MSSMTPRPDSVVGLVDGQRCRAGGCDGLRGHPVVQLAVVDDVTQGVDMAVSVPVNVDSDAVHGEVQPWQGRSSIAGSSHTVLAGFGAIV